MKSLLALGAVGAVLAALAPAAPATAATGHTYVIANCVDAEQTPHKVVAACGDLGAFAVVRDWTSWTGHQARGRGTFVVNTCRPDCAAGNVVRYPATFSLHRVVTSAGGQRLFSRLGVTYVRGGEQHDTTLALPTAPLS